MSKSVCALVPLITVTTGIFASAAALSCASPSTGLPIATMIASTLRWIRSSSCCACFGRLPSELRICTFQPLAVAASFAAFATRACVSDDIWNATMPTSNAKAGLASAANAAATTIRFMVVSLHREGGAFECAGRERDRRHDGHAEKNVLHEIGRADQHQPIVEQRQDDRAGDGAGHVGMARLEHRHAEQDGGDRLQQIVARH